MSVNFSTIGPMNSATISKQPAYSAKPAEEKTELASTSMDSYEPAKKKSHWFRNTIVTLVVLAAALGAGRKWLPALKNSPIEVSKDTNLLGKAKVYTAKAGEYIVKGVESCINGIKKLVSSKKPVDTPPAS